MSASLTKWDEAGARLQRAKAIFALGSLLRRQRGPERIWRSILAKVCFTEMELGDLTNREGGHRKKEALEAGAGRVQARAVDTGRSARGPGAEVGPDTEERY